MDIQNTTSIKRAQFTISNAPNNFINTNTVNWNNNITTSTKQSLLLDDSYFFLEYELEVPAQKTIQLAPNFFLSMIQSINFKLGSVSQNLSATSPHRTFPLIANLNRCMNNNFEEFMNFSQAQDASIITNDNTDLIPRNVPIGNYADGLPNTNIFTLNAGRVYTNTVEAPKIFTDYIYLPLRDLIPLANDGSSLVQGLISFSISLSFNSGVHIISNDKPNTFVLKRLNYHYSLVEYPDLSPDLDLTFDPVSTYNITTGRFPNLKIASLTTDMIPGASITNMEYSNLQLQLNTIRYLIICPYIEKTSAKITFRNASSKYLITPARTSFFDIPANYKTGLAEVGHKAFSYTNVKVIINGVDIYPTNILPDYKSSEFADFYNYLYSFMEKQQTEIKRQGTGLSYQTYNNFFKPVIVPLAESTKYNNFNQCSIYFDIVNKYEVAAGGDITFGADYFILSDVFFNYN